MNYCVIIRINHLSFLSVKVMFERLSILVCTSNRLVKLFSDLAILLGVVYGLGVYCHKVYQRAQQDQRSCDPSRAWRTVATVSIKSLTG